MKKRYSGGPGRGPCDWGPTLAKAGPEILIYLKKGRRDNTICVGWAKLILPFGLKRTQKYNVEDRWMVRPMVTYSRMHTTKTSGYAKTYELRYVFEDKNYAKMKK